VPPYAGPPVASRQGDAASPLRLLAYLALAITLIVLDDQAGWLPRSRTTRPAMASWSMKTASCATNY